MPAITASTLADMLPRYSRGIPASHSIHNLWRGGAPFMVPGHVRYNLTTRITAGTPTKTPACPVGDGYAAIGWVVLGADRNDDGTVSVRIENRGTGKSYDYYSVTIILDADATLPIARRRIW